MAAESQASAHVHVLNSVLAAFLSATTARVFKNDYGKNRGISLKRVPPRLLYVTRSAVSVSITASPMLAKTTRQYSRCSINCSSCGRTRHSANENSVNGTIFAMQPSFVGV
jgi:hypothetical protein